MLQHTKKKLGIARRVFVDAQLLDIHEGYQGIFWCVISILNDLWYSSASVLHFFLAKKMFLWSEWPNTDWNFAHELVLFKIVNPVDKGVGKVDSSLRKEFEEKAGNWFFQAKKLFFSKKTPVLWGTRVSDPPNWHMVGTSGDPKYFN